MTYIDDMEMTNYIVDRNREYSEVLAENETVHVYGDTLLQGDGDTIISGLNNSVIAEIGVDEVKNIRYDDYGYSDEMISGHGYKGEMQDESGLIYLRARYYDPDLMRFIQIDTKYAGEKEDVTSQNRYAYTLNNPYKYVDRDGNRSIRLNVTFDSDSKLKKLLKSAKSVANTMTKALKQTEAATSDIIHKTINCIEKVTTGKINGNTIITVNNKTISINESLAPMKKIIATLKCPKEEKKAWYEEAWDGVKSFGKDVWNGLTGAASWIWSKVCDAGSFLIQGAQQILSMIDAVLDVVATGAAVAVFAAGIVAVGATLASAIPALATTVVLGHEIGAIGGYSTGFALFTGKIAIGASGAQTISGASGCGLDFKKISKGEAKSRVANGIRNLSITYVGLESVMVSELINEEVVKPGAGGGEGKTLNADELKRIGTPGKNSGIRNVKGTEADARNLFDNQVIKSTVEEKAPGVFVGQGTDGFTYTFRSVSKSGPPTIDIKGIQGLRKIKFIP